MGRGRPRCSAPRLAEDPARGRAPRPVARAAETAGVVARRSCPAYPLREHAAAGDYVPHVPGPGEVEPEYAEAVLASLVDVTAEEASHGAALAAQAIDLLTGPVDGDERHELVVTHAFTIGWLVRHALGAPGLALVGAVPRPHGPDGDPLRGGPAAEPRRRERPLAPARRPEDLTGAQPGWQAGHQYVARSRPAGPVIATSILVPQRRQAARSRR